MEDTMLTFTAKNGEFGALDLRVIRGFVTTDCNYIILKGKGGDEPTMIPVVEKPAELYDKFKKLKREESVF